MKKNNMLCLLTIMITFPSCVRAMKESNGYLRLLPSHLHEQIKKEMVLIEEQKDIDVMTDFLAFLATADITFQESTILQEIFDKFIRDGDKVPFNLDVHRWILTKPKVKEFIQKYLGLL